MSEHDMSLLEESLEYHFKNKMVFVEALTHKSFYHENPGKAEDQ